MPLLDNHLSVAQLALELGVSVRTIQRWRRLRIGPTPTLIGRTVRYHADDVAVWLRAQRQEQPRRGTGPRWVPAPRPRHGRTAPGADA